MRYNLRVDDEDFKISVVPHIAAHTSLEIIALRFDG
jgi:hypothetical protein